MRATPYNEALIADDMRAADGAEYPRVTLSSIEQKIVSVIFFTGGEAARAFDASPLYPPDLDVLTICLVTMGNGFTVVGKSAPADMRNFDEAKGREFAYEDAVRQLWPLEGYLLRSRKEEF